MVSGIGSSDETMAAEQLNQDLYYPATDGLFHYIDWGGAGPMAHLAHATGLCAAAYTPLVKLLQPRMHVVGMDDRGHGKTTVLADVHKLKNWDIFVDDLEGLFTLIDQPIIAMGHSRGAVASMLLALRKPERVRALVLIDPTILPAYYTWFVYFARLSLLSRFYPIAARAAKRNPAWPDRETILRTYQSKSMFKAWREGFLEGYIEDGAHKTNDGSIHLACEPAWEARCFSAYPHDLWHYIPKITQPVLVLYGDKSDTFLAPAAKRFQAQVPQAILRCFKDTSHFVPMERPQETAEAICDFVASL